MSGDMAIRVGENMPDQYRKMYKSSCTNCGATFSIIHQMQFADVGRAERQARSFDNILAEEHVDPKFTGHPRYYELDDLDSN